MKIRIFRSMSGEQQVRYDTFNVEITPGMTVLSTLFQIQDHYDDSLAFRFSCRGAVCGACAMLINRVPRLACRTQIQSLLKEMAEFQSEESNEEISDDTSDALVIEPLPHLPVIKDLIVDMDPFFKKLMSIDPIFRPSGPEPEKERLLSGAEVHELERYTNCILCGACYGACPNVRTAPDFIGPAALATLYRFHIDPREPQGIGRLIRADNPSGWGGCEFHSRCRAVCPKGVTPDIAIGRARKELKQRERSGGFEGP